MLTRRPFTNRRALPFLAITLVCLTLPLAHVHAQDLSTPANIVWTDNGSCVGTVNGQVQSHYAAVANDSITINITNSSSQLSVSVQITESGQSTYTATLLPGGTANPTF